MKRMTKSLTMEESKGVINRLTQCLSDPAFGAYWRRELEKFLDLQPTHTLDYSDLEYVLFKTDTWELARKHFETTGDLWFNKPHWPFQICVLPMTKYFGEGFLRAWMDAGLSKYREATKELQEIVRTYWEEDDNQCRNFYFIRIQARYLVKVSTPLFDLSEINKSHNFNHFTLYPCPDETPFYIRLHSDIYYGQEPTMVSRKIIDNSNQQIYFFDKSPAFNQGVTRISKENFVKSKQSDWWIFHYTLPDWS